MLLQLKLNNFKRHENLVVDFTQGLNVIMGPNYRGKSSILHGILYAFFGASAVPCNADKIPRTGSTTFSVALTFRLGDDLWEIVRTKSTDNILKNGEKQATGKSAVAAQVQKLLNMSQSQFTRLLYAEQKRAENLVSLGSADLNRTIEEVAGTSVVKEAITKLSQLLSTSNAAADAVRSVMGEAPDAGAAEELAEAVRLAKATAAVEARGLEDAQRTTSDQRALLNDLRLRKNSYDQALQAVQRAKSALAQAEAAAGSLTRADDAQVASARAEVDRLTSELAGVRAAYTEAKKAVEQWDAHQRELAALTAAEAKLLALVPVPPRPEAADLANATASVERSATAVAVAKQAFTQLSEAARNGTCSACKRPFEDHDPVKLADELGAASSELKECEEDLENSRVNLRMLQAAVTAHDEAVAVNTHRESAKAQWAARKAAFAAIQVPQGSPEKLHELDTQGRALAASLQQAKDRLLVLENGVQQYTRAIANVSAAKDALASAEAHVPAAVDEGQVQSADAQVRQAEIMQSECQARLNQARLAQQSAEQSLTALQAAVERYRANEGKLRQHEKKADQSKRLRAFLQTNFDTFMSETWDGLLAMASHFTRQGTEGFISEILRSEDGKFEYIEEGEKFSVMGSASGAQRSLMGLSMQIAMSEMLPCPLPVLMLDEASADMDPDVSAALVTVLRNLNKQVIIVSHREMDAAVADNVIAVE